MAEEKKAKAEPAKPKRDKAPKAGKKGSAGEGTESRPAPVSTTDAVAPRLFESYKEKAIPALTKQFNYKNPMQVPRLEKIVVNMGLGAAVANPKIIDTAVEELKALSGQRPVVTRAKKAIANFKLCRGPAISRESRARPSTARATTRSAFVSRSFSQRSTTTELTQSRA